ncbi:hypothetical protein J6590_082903 [Homalodisca vitripennis]|nr:hypothetical protein J6590_082903 [Homalodisca vitripennis]
MRIQVFIDVDIYRVVYVDSLIMGITSLWRRESFILKAELSSSCGVVGPTHNNILIESTLPANALRYGWKTRLLRFEIASETS